MYSEFKNLSLEKCPALVLNADYRPLSYYPLSLWSWQDSIKSVFLDRVSIVSQYDRVIRSPSYSMKLPSVIALKSFVKPLSNPNFTRFNVFLRDKFSCQYCGSKKDLTFDHLLPRSKGGKTDWDNVVTACSSCNVKKVVDYTKTQVCYFPNIHIDHLQRTFIKMEKIFHLIFYTKAGWITYTGT